MTVQSPLARTLRVLDPWVIEQSPAALCVCEAPDGEILRYNERAVHLWGRTPVPGERVTGAWRTRFPGGRLLAVQESAMEAVLRGAPTQERRVVVERQDGSCVTVDAHVSPLRDHAGHLVGAIDAFEDVHDNTIRAIGHAARYRMGDGQEPLCDNCAADLSPVYDSALIGVWDYDLRTRCAVRSETHDQIYGYPRALQEWTFDTFLDHVAPEYRDRIKTRFEGCVTSGECEFDCRIVRADGVPAWIWSRGRVMRDANGRPLRVVGLVMDLTRQMRAELWLQQENRRKDTFVATLAHELRQPLCAMLAAAGVTRLAPGTPAATQAGEVMQRQIDHMSRLVEDLVDAARWAHGRVTLHTCRLDLRDVIRDATQDVAAAVAERRHELIVMQASRPIWVQADRQRLHQVLTNLLRNSATYTDPGGRISLTLTTTASTITLHVMDSGRGIAAHVLPHVFDLFSQGHPHEGTGLGIGLSVAREIVTLHGGTIDARSDGSGKGAEFVVTLPLATTVPARPTATGASAAGHQSVQ
jgi:signal transduction histidine kinase